MKYLGSKARLAKYLVPMLQANIHYYHINTYIEPFVGGFNIIDKISCNRRIGNDIDSYVTTLVDACKRDSSLLDKLPDRVSREHYYDVRDKANGYPMWYVAAIMLFASYNGRVYGGCYVAESNTAGGYRNYYDEAKRNFAEQLPQLSDIIVTNCDYRELELHKYLGQKDERVLFYCDPPYSMGKGYSEKFDTGSFWDWARERSAEGHIVLVSEYTAPKDFECVWEQKVKSHLDNRNKVERVERLFQHISMSNT